MPKIFAVLTFEYKPSPGFGGYCSTEWYWEKELAEEYYKSTCEKNKSKQNFGVYFSEVKVPTEELDVIQETLDNEWESIRVRAKIRQENGDELIKHRKKKALELIDEPVLRALRESWKVVSDATSKKKPNKIDATRAMAYLVEVMDFYGLESFE